MVSAEWVLRKRLMAAHRSAACAPPPNASGHMPSEGQSDTSHKCQSAASDASHGGGTGSAGGRGWALTPCASNMVRDEPAVSVSDSMKRILPARSASQSRRRCGRVPAQMWASPGSDVGESRLRCGRVPAQIIDVQMWAQVRVLPTAASSSMALCARTRDVDVEQMYLAMRRYPLACDRATRPGYCTCYGAPVVYVACHVPGQCHAVSQPHSWMHDPLLSSVARPAGAFARMAPAL